MVRGKISSSNIVDRLGFTISLVEHGNKDGAVAMLRSIANDIKPRVETPWETVVRIEIDEKLQAYERRLKSMEISLQDIWQYLEYDEQEHY